MKLWKGRLPKRPPEELVRELYEAENKDKAEPSGSQDMIGLVYPGINRLDYDFAVNGGVFPSHIESLNDVRVSRWLERVLHVLPIEPRPQGYNPLGEKHLDPQWIARLGQTGKDCFNAISRRDVGALGASMNDCMVCWEKLLPNVVRHPAIKVDLKAILHAISGVIPARCIPAAVADICSSCRMNWCPARFKLPFGQHRDRLPPPDKSSSPARSMTFGRGTCGSWRKPPG